MAALHVRVPKDILDFKKKIALGLTLRQIICLSVSVCLGLPLFFYLKKYSDIDPFYLTMPVIFIPLSFAVFKKNGQTLEKYLVILLKNAFRPKIRVYETENIYSEVIHNYKRLNELEKGTTRKEKKKTDKLSGKGK